MRCRDRRFHLRCLAAPPSRDSDQSGTEKKKRRGFGHCSGRFGVNEIVHRDHIKWSLVRSQSSTAARNPYSADTLSSVEGDA
jgi:hypothetical protein